MGTLAVETNIFTVSKGFSNVTHRVDSIISGRSPPLYCTLTLISMQGHQNRNPFLYLRVLDYSVVIIWSYMVLEKLKINLINISIYTRAWYCHHSPSQVFAYPTCNTGDCSESLPSVPCTPGLASYQFTGSQRVGYWPEELKGRAPALLGSLLAETLSLRVSH